jgi:hypothetical protein
MPTLRDLWSRFVSVRRDPDGARLAERADGSRVFMDAEAVKYLDSDAPEPSQRQLDAMLSRARRARVTELVPQGDRLGRQLRLDIRDPVEVASLGATFRISEEPHGHCMCFGNPHVAFLDEHEAVLAEVSLHHGVSMRWSVWRDDARLLDGRPLLDWLASRGVRAPLDEYEALLAQKEAQRVAWERWQQATPECLQPLLEPYSESGGQVIFVPSPDSAAPQRIEGLIAPSGMPQSYFAEVASRLDGAHPNPQEQARLLFAWLGHGGEQWTGFPMYEEVPECLLLRLSSHDLIRGLDESDKADPVVVGAARFFAGWRFGTYRAKELKRIPGRLRRLMHEHALRSPDPDRLERAYSAFG